MSYVDFSIVSRPIKFIMFTARKTNVLPIFGLSFNIYIIPTLKSQPLKRINQAYINGDDYTDRSVKNIILSNSNLEKTERYRTEIIFLSDQGV